MLEVTDKDFKADIIKMFKWKLVNVVKTSEKLEILHKEAERFSKEIKICKEEPNRNFRAEKYHNQNETFPEQAP